MHLTKALTLGEVVEAAITDLGGGSKMSTDFDAVVFVVLADRIDAYQRGSLKG